MRGSLGATLTDVAWVITAYAIANVIVIPMTSWLSQQFGRRNYFVASIILFTVCSFPVRKCHEYLGIGSLSICSRNRWWCLVGNRPNHHYRKLSRCQTWNGTSYLRNGRNCWSNTWVRHWEVIWSIIILGLIFFTSIFRWELLPPFWPFHS